MLPTRSQGLISPLLDRTTKDRLTVNHIHLDKCESHLKCLRMYNSNNKAPQKFIRLDWITNTNSILCVNILCQFIFTLIRQESKLSRKRPCDCYFYSCFGNYNFLYELLPKLHKYFYLSFDSLVFHSNLALA